MTPSHDPDYRPEPAPYAPQGRPDYFRDPRLKSPVMAGVLSLMPGLGQVYLGYIQLGFVNAATVAAMIALLSSNALGRLEPMVGVFMSFFWLYNIVDAHRRAMLINERIARMDPAELPDGTSPFSAQGRLVAGVILIVFGTLALLEQRFGVSMAWLQQWWPAGLVLLGLYLLGRAVRDRQARTD